MDKVELSTFPSSKTEALTMLYLSQQDLTRYQPKELAAMYAVTYNEIRQGFKDLRAKRSEEQDQ